jgi:tRNA(Leu) C34 or U34 (ribose-2'-O)-methylase TrmL
VPYRPDAQTNIASFVRTTWTSVRTLHYIEKLLIQLASVRTSQQPVQTPLSIRPSFRFFPSSFMGRLNRPDDVDSCLTRFSLRKQSQFKFNRPDTSQHGPDARSTDMEIVDSTSTVRTPSFHGPDARTVNMEIAC